MNGKTPEEVFLSFLYPEVKDLAKNFLTLISATIVFSITFAEKVVDFAVATRAQKSAVVTSYAVLIASLGCCGLGLYTVFMAAEEASGSIVYEYGSDFRTLTKVAYHWLDAAGALYGLGLVLLVVVSLSKFWPSQK